MDILDHPKRIVIELTPECNLSCPVCPRHYIGSEEKNGYMPKILWKKLIGEIAADFPATTVLPFWRGEALLHPDFIELIEFALNKSTKIHISTNGILVDGRYARILLDCEYVNFSIHNEPGYKHAKKFLSLRKSDHPAIQISFVRGEKSSQGIFDSVIANKDLEGFDSIRLYDEHSKNGIFGKSGGPADAARTFCPKLSGTMVVASKGLVSRCSYIWIPEKDIDLNNLTIKEAWFSKGLQKIRDKYPDAKCKSCEQWGGYTCGESYQVVNGRIKHRIFNTSGMSEC